MHRRKRHLLRIKLMHPCPCDPWALAAPATHETTTPSQTPALEKATDGGGWMHTDVTAAETCGAAVDAGEGEDDGYNNLMSPLFSAAAAATDKTGG